MIIADYRTQLALSILIAWILTALKLDGSIHIKWITICGFSLTNYLLEALIVIVVAAIRGISTIRTDTRYKPEGRRLVWDYKSGEMFGDSIGVDE